MLSLNWNTEFQIQNTGLFKFMIKMVGIFIYAKSKMFEVLIGGRKLYNYSALVIPNN